MTPRTITFEPIGDDLYNVRWPSRTTRPTPELTETELAAIVEREPWNFAARHLAADRMAEAGRFEEACELRHEGCMLAVESLPEEEDIELAWDNHPANQEFVGIIAASATDHYMFGDFEVAAALFETAFTLDTEDHLEVVPQMLCAFIAADDREAYDLYSINLAPKGAESSFVRCLADFQRGDEPDPKARLKHEAPEILAELALDDHPADDNLIEALNGKHPTRAQQARALWLKHTPLWSAFPELIARLKA